MSTGPSLGDCANECECHHNRFHNQDVSISPYISPQGFFKIDFGLFYWSVVGQTGVKLPGITLHWPGVGVLFFQLGFQRTLLASVTYMTCKHYLRQKQESGRRKILFV